MTLAKAFRKLSNAEIAFLMRSIPEGTRHAESSGFAVQTMEEKIGAQDENLFILKACRDFRAGAYVEDLPFPAPGQRFQALNQMDILTLEIDDFRYTHHGADVVLNSSILADEKRYKTNHAPEARYFLGPDYFIFDPGDERERAFFNTEKPNILFSFGGADPEDLSAASIRLILQHLHLFQDISFHWILGPGYANRGYMEKTIKKLPNASLIHAPEKIIPWFRAADFVVCAGGRTQQELICIKKPFISIASASHEQEGVEAIERLGYSCGGFAEWKPELLLHALLKHCRSLSHGNPNQPILSVKQKEPH